MSKRILSMLALASVALSGGLANAQDSVDSILPAGVVRAKNAVGTLFVTFGESSAANLGNQAYGGCTASLIASDVILTNHHCIPEDDENTRKQSRVVSFHLRAPGTDLLERYQVVEVLAADEINDILVLRLEEGVALKDVFPLPIATPAATPKHPWRISSYLAGDFINDPRPGTAPQIVIELCSRAQVTPGTIGLTTCSARPGNSGSPIVNDAGEIVALLKSIDFRPPTVAVKGTEYIAGSIGDIFATPSGHIFSLYQRSESRLRHLTQRRVANEWERLRIEGINFSASGGFNSRWP